MHPRTTVPSPPDTAHPSPATSQTAPGSAVLDRIAARVQLRLAAEQTVSNSSGDGSHAASLIWPWPL
ncbi:HaaA family cyclophane-containing RiPP peptide [Streptomyces sp. NPDC059373]